MTIPSIALPPLFRDNRVPDSASDRDFPDARPPNGSEQSRYRLYSPTNIISVRDLAFLCFALLRGAKKFLAFGTMELLNYVHGS